MEKKTKSKQTEHVRQNRSNIMHAWSKTDTAQPILWLPEKLSAGAPQPAHKIDRAGRDESIIPIMPRIDQIILVALKAYLKSQAPNQTHVNCLRSVLNAGGILRRKQDNPQDD